LVHPKVLEEYEKNDYEYIESSRDQREERFKYLSAEHDIDRIVTKIVRQKLQTGEEFIWYEERQVSHDLIGNEITFNAEVGRYQMPEFRKEWDQVTKRIVGKEIVQRHWVYDIPYTKENLDKIFKMPMDTNATCYAFRGDNKYGIKNIEDFRDATFEELLLMGKADKSLIEVRSMVAQQERSREELKQKVHGDRQSQQQAAKSQ
jgi:hypothetical protein